MLKEQILELQKEQSFPSITIMLPTHRNFLETEKDKIFLKNLAKECEEKLLLKINKKETEYFLDKIKNVISNIDYHHLLDGLGIFVNRNKEFTFIFPFGVPKLSVVDDTFETKFLIKRFNRNVRYWLLSVAEKPTRLYEGYDTNLIEMTHSGFPIDIDEVLDQHPDRIKLTYEKFQTEKFRQFVRYVDSRFNELKKNNNLPVIVVGGTKTLSTFQEVTDRKDVIGTIVGSFNKANQMQLAKSAFHIVSEHRKKVRDEVLNKFKAEFNKGKASMGLLEVWMLANQGRIKTLLVEENYHQPAKFKENTPIFINKSEGPYELDDIVDELIEIVFIKNGNVLFYEDNLLKDFQRIGAILRY